MNKLILGRLSALCALFLVFNSLSAQDFAWIKGTNLANQGGIYGTLGTAAPANNPGARAGAATWKDAAGNFWLFGGSGYDYIGNYGDLSDLWKYDPTTNQWAFMKGNDIIAQPTIYSNLGVPSPTGKPGGRHNCVSWTDASGNLWLFGGYGLAGGSGLGYLNDLWKYNIATAQWTYVNGSAFCYTAGSYGTMGTPSSTNTPGSRVSSLTWTDASGDLWLFGGFGNATSSVTTGYMNDMWRYNITTNEWTWIRGSSLTNQNGVYGSPGVSAPANNPGSRALSNGWTDASGNLWLFGGDGWDQNAITNNGLLNDLWKYNTGTDEWTWVKGNNLANQTGVYGLVGAVGSNYTPGGRSGSMTWKDAVGNFWLFGGNGIPASGSTAGGLNDLWKYSVTLNQWSWIKGTSLINQNGIYGTVGVGSAANLPGARSTHAGWIDASNDLYLFGGFGQATSGAAGSLNDLWKYTNCYISPITMTVIARDSVICAGETTSLTVTGSANYLWLNNLSTNSYLVINPTTTTAYSVVTSDTKGCRYNAVFTETVSACLGIENSVSQAPLISIFPNPSSGVFQIQMGTTESQKTVLSIRNTLGQEVFRQALTSADTELRTNLKKGIYYYELKGSSHKTASGKLIIE